MYCNQRHVYVGNQLNTLRNIAAYPQPVKGISIQFERRRLIIVPDYTNWIFSLTPYKNQLRVCITESWINAITT